MKNYYSFCPFLVLCIVLVSCSSENSQEEGTEETISTVKSSLASPTENFLFLSDIHLNATDSINPTDYGEDTRMLLWNKAKAKIKEVIKHKSPRFIMYTGDLPDHFPDSGSTHNKNIRKMLEELTSIAHGIPFFYTPGNNDALGGDYYAFTNCSGENAFSLDPSGQYPAPNANKLYYNDSIYGYYSAKPFDGLRIIALNSVLLGHTYHSDNCHSHNLTPETQLEAGDHQMSWLKKQLQSADSLKEKVYIMMHIPPGLDAYKTHEYHSDYSMWAHKHWQDDFLNYVNQYESTISGIFYGHTHMDELRLLANSSGGYSEVAFSCPGITPRSKNNPGFKIVSYNTDMEPTNFTTYFTNLPCTEWGTASYTFNNIYHRPDSLSGSIKDWILNMDTNKVENNMKEFYTVSHKKGASWSKLGIKVSY